MTTPMSKSAAKRYRIWRTPIHRFLSLMFLAFALGGCAFIAPAGGSFGGKIAYDELWKPYLRPLIFGSEEPEPGPDEEAEQLEE